MRSTWIKHSEHLRTFLLLVFGLALLARHFNWHEITEVPNLKHLQDIQNLSIIIYALVYVLELRLKLHEKSIEIAKLKTKLSNYDG